MKGPKSAQTPARKGFQKFFNREGHRMKLHKSFPMNFLAITAIYVRTPVFHSLIVLQHVWRRSVYGKVSFIHVYNHLKG